MTRDDALVAIYEYWIRETKSFDRACDFAAGMDARIVFVWNEPAYIHELNFRRIIRR
jgi:hypothetical protein